MGLFKKKEPREIKDDDPLLVKLWYNPRTHAMMVLGIYIFIFAVILLIIRLSPTSNTNAKRSLSGDKLSNLFNNSENNINLYDVSLSVENGNYFFSGEKSSEIISGTLLYNGKTENIIVEDGICRIKNTDDTEDVSSNAKCPENIDYRLLDINSIYNIVKDLNGNLFGNEYYLFRLNRDEEVKIYLSGDELNKISYKIKNSSYTYSVRTNATKEENIGEEN